jgi:flagellin-like hook-associated protein FlgL
MTGSVFSFQVGAHIDDKNQILVQPKTYTEIVDTTGLDMDGYVNDLTEIVNRGLNVLDTNRLYTGLIMLADRYIENTNLARSELGAISNRLNHVVNNLTNISINLSAAKGGIEDADFALETTQLAKNQILQQASTAMLAQANASKQNVLSLLQG